MKRDGKLKDIVKTLMSQKANKLMSAKSRKSGEQTRQSVQFLVFACPSTKQLQQTLLNLVLKGELDGETHRAIYCFVLRVLATKN